LQANYRFSVTSQPVILLSVCVFVEIDSWRQFFAEKQALFIAQLCTHLINGHG
jgi:hypothetical protein